MRLILIKVGAPNAADFGPISHILLVQKAGLWQHAASLFLGRIRT